MSVPLLIGLVPPPAVCQYIQQLRRTSTAPIKDAPHITLVVNSFASIPAVTAVVERIAARHKVFHATGAGLRSFNEDPAFAGYPLVWVVRRSRALTHLQRELVEALTPLRTKDQEHYFLRHRSQYSTACQQNLARYGYPYGPVDWRFHATATITKQPVQPVSFPVNWTVNAITMYHYHPTRGFEPAEQFALSEHH